MQQFGWQPDDDGSSAILADSSAPVHELTNSQIMACLTPNSWTTRKQPIVLFDALRALHPNWVRWAQGIGDCVSWGYELGCTLVAAVDIYIRKEPWQWLGEFATEPIYGGARVEALGKKSGGWGDGAYGAAAAKFVTQWGALHRIDYSLSTGDESHNLTKYSKDKAKDWGNFGCGGKQDSGALDSMAKSQPVENAYKITTFEQAMVAIESGYPIPVCSSQGLGKRDSEGFAPPIRKPWHHCMCFAGVRYDKPGLLVSNSWGNSWGASGRVPGVEWDSVKKCSAWVDHETAGHMLARGDSYALTGVDGLKSRRIDWSGGWQINGR